MSWFSGISTVIFSFLVSWRYAGMVSLSSLSSSQSTPSPKRTVYVSSYSWPSRTKIITNRSSAWGWPRSSQSRLREISLIARILFLIRTLRSSHHYPSPFDSRFRTKSRMLNFSVSSWEDKGQRHGQLTETFRRVRWILCEQSSWPKTELIRCDVVETSPSLFMIVSAAESEVGSPVIVLRRRILMVFPTTNSNLNLSSPFILLTNFFGNSISSTSPNYRGGQGRSSKIFSGLPSSGSWTTRNADLFVPCFWIFQINSILTFN